MCSIRKGAEKRGSQTHTDGFSKTSQSQLDGSLDDRWKPLRRGALVDTVPQKPNDPSNSPEKESSGSPLTTEKLLRKLGKKKGLHGAVEFPVSTGRTGLRTLLMKKKPGQRV